MARASSPVLSKINGLEQGACSTVKEAGSRLGNMVALGPRSGGIFEFGWRNAIRKGPAAIVSGSPKVELSQVTESVAGALPKSTWSTCMSKAA